MKTLITVPIYTQTNMKTIITFLAALLATTISHAQVTPANGEAWWGHWNSFMPLTTTAALGSGDNSCAIRLLANAQARLKDCKVQGLRFYIDDKTAITSAKAWLSKSMSGTPDMAETDIPIESLRDMTHDGQPTEIRFTQPVDILPSRNAYASLYAGFTLTLASGATCRVMTSGSEASMAANSFYHNGNAVEKTHGALALQLLMSGGSLQSHCVEPQVLGSQIADLSKSLEQTYMPLTIENWGTSPVHNLGVTLTATMQGGETTQSQSATIQLTTPVTELGVKQTVSLPVKLSETPYSYDCKAQVSLVDGQQNGTTATAGGTLTTLRQQATKRVVMEEFTGTWCPNCVRGIAGIEMLSEMFADRFIPIAVHSGDPMAVDSYMQSNIKRRAGTSLPACSVDRLYDCDPYLGDDLLSKHFITDAIVARAMEQTATADLRVIQARLSADRQLSVSVGTTFWHGTGSSPMRLVIVVCADSLKGEGKDWAQVNGLYQKTGYDDDLSFYTDGPRYIEMAYNHVPIATLGIDQGIEGSIRLPITCGEEQVFDCLVDLADNTLVQDTKQLSVIAMLLDTASGTLANAASAPVAAMDSEGIRHLDSVTADKRPGAVFDLLGRRTHPASGRHQKLLIVGGKVVTGHK